MTILKRILKILAIVLLAIAAIGLIFFPSHIQMERSISINQKQDVIFNYVNDLSNWNKWSPWYDYDTTANYILSGPQSGKGATINWDSEHKNVKKGSITISESSPDTLIRQDLNFMENGTAKSYYRFSSDANGTLVKWGFEVEAGVNPVMRIMGSFMKSFVGEDFDKGLSKLKLIMESIPETDSVKTEY